MSDRESMDNGHSPNGHRSDRESEHSDGGRSPRPVDRSRSRSGSQKRRRHSRSRSRSFDRTRRDTHDRERRRSRSPARRGANRPGQGDREAPPPGRCLGVFGLSIHTHQRDLEEVFGKYGPIEDVQIVFDAQTGRSRGFAFVYFKDKSSAAEAKERCNGIDINGRQIRVDFSVTQRAHTPTPGIYMGRPSNPKDGGRSEGGRGGGGGGRPERFDRGDRRDGGFRGGRDSFRDRRDFRRRSPSPHYRGGGGGGRDRSPPRYRGSRY